MKHLSENDDIRVRVVVQDTLVGNGIEDWCGGMINPFMYEVTIPLAHGKRKVERICNELFHALGILPDGENVAVGDFGDYCCLVISEDGENYSAIFNHPVALKFRPGDEEYQYTMKSI